MVFAGIVLAAWLALVMWLVIGALADHAPRRMMDKAPKGTKTDGRNSMRRAVSEHPADRRIAWLDVEAIPAQIPIDA